jgi:endonuclease-3 related protein
MPLRGFPTRQPDLRPRRDRTTRKREPGRDNTAWRSKDGSRRPDAKHFAALKGGATQPLPAQPLPVLREFYDSLYRDMGPQHWWPAEGPFEVIVGAILTQSAAWVNVEQAIANLKQARALTPSALERISMARLRQLIRPSGYYRQKAVKLKDFVRFLRREFGGSLPQMFRTPPAKLREQLLSVRGIGPETADSILLYAANHPLFVVDAYTRRILIRHGLVNEKATYDDIRALFESNLPRDTQLYNDYHALLVKVGKFWCRPQAPLCRECPLGSFLPKEEDEEDEP